MSFLPAESDARDDDHEQFLRLFDQEGDEAVPKADADGSEPELTAESDDGPADTTELDDAYPDDAEPDNAEPAEQHTDRFLQTPFAKEKLDDKLLRHFYDARTAEEEQGVGILYLACGFLKWRESPSSELNRFAPLLLIPVELSRNTARSKFRLRFRDDEIVTNLSIQARLQQNFGIRLPDLPESPQDDETWI